VCLCEITTQQPTNQPTKQQTNQSTTIQPTNQPETWVGWGPLYLCKIIRYSPLNKSAEPEPEPEPTNQPPDIIIILFPGAWNMELYATPQVVQP
jgi:hypothetical protein